MTATYDSLASFGRCSSSTEQNKSGGSEIEFTVAFVRSQTPPIPEGTKPLQLQVAGHVFGRANGHKKNKIGITH
jgi:hypothetical protein